MAQARVSDVIISVCFSEGCLTSMYVFLCLVYLSIWTCVWIGMARLNRTWHQLNDDRF